MPDVLRRSRRTGPLVVLAALTLAGQVVLVDSNAAESQYTFTRLAGPDEGAFLPLAINAKGQIVGEHVERKDASSHAVLRDADGRFTTIEHPDGRFTRLLGINARCQIVGTAVDEKRMFGFVRERDGKFVRLKLNVPDPNPTSAAINDEGAILGCYFDRRSRPRFFVRSEDGEFRMLPSGLTGSYWGLNSKGQAVGEFVDNTHTKHGLLVDEKNKVTLIDWPNTTLTEAKAINDQGVIVGIYLNIDDKLFGLHRSFVRDATGKLIPLDYPGARQTKVAGINNAGHIVGRYEGRDGDQGFLAVPNQRP
jgi:hypothetical protein